ncbi:hypothetical protein [Phenylobacterium sp.]|uniref:hypothetical protein n=1 Tax=Phenylobacterium sp. TaxID=1871053 RepID=UPI003D2A1246
MDGEFWAAVAGAVLGGGIAAVVQLMSVRHTRRERNRSNAYALLIKVGQIYSHLRGVHGIIDSALKDATDNERADPWRVIDGLVNAPSHVTFSHEEVALVVELQAMKLFNDLIMLDEKHNATIDVMRFYTQKRTELVDALTPEGIDGHMATAELSPSLRMRAIALNRLVDGMREYLGADVGHALNVLQQLGSVFQDKLGVVYTALPSRPNLNSPISGSS